VPTTAVNTASFFDLKSNKKGGTIAEITSH
jgi:hypothetical protein